MNEDREPQPYDGPDCWADYAAWLTRQELHQHLYSFSGANCLWCNEPREDDHAEG